MSRCSMTNRAHPRMGGEHDHMTLGAYKYGGSPPHGRGAQFLDLAGADEGGLTPAWAGSTLPPSPPKSL